MKQFKKELFFITDKIGRKVYKIKKTKNSYEYKKESELTSEDLPKASHLFFNHYKEALSIFNKSFNKNEYSIASNICEIN